MKITGLTNNIRPLTGSESSNKTGKTGFADILNGMLSSTNDLQKQAEAATHAFVTGDTSLEVHDVVLASEKARLALDLTVAIRNKLVEAYQEIMRMQI